MNHYLIHSKKLYCAACRHLNVVTGDTKNFHAWKYRSWLVERAGKSPHSEEDFTRSLLEAEPNNFSALHHRIVALAAAHMSASSTSEALAVTPAFGVTCQGRPESTDTPMAIRDWQRQGTDATMAVDAPETAAEAQRTTQSAYTEEAAAIHVAKMQYSGARVLPISLEVIGKELKALYEVRDPFCTLQHIHICTSSNLSPKCCNCCSPIVFDSASDS